MEHLSVILRGKRAALAAPRFHFAWQARRLEHLTLILRGSTRSTSREVHGSPATIEYCGRWLHLPGRRNTCHFAWQVQRLERVSFILRVRCYTQSTSVSFCMAGAPHRAPPERSAEVRQRLSTVDASCVCLAAAALGAPHSHFAVAGAARRAPPESRRRRATIEHRRSTWSTFCMARATLGAPQSHLARQPQHSKHLQTGPRKIEYCGRRLRCTWSTSVSFCMASAQHLQHLGLILHGRRSTWSTSVSFCVAGAALGAPESHFAWQVQHLKHPSCVLQLGGNTINTTSSIHDTINTTPSTQHHQHNTINTTPSTQHHLHNIIYTTSSHTGRCSTWSTAILPLLPHSC